MVGQAALHHVEAVAGAGPDGGKALTARAAAQPGQRLNTLVGRRNLENAGHDLLALGEGLGEGPRGDEAAAQLERQLLGHVAEGLQLLHVLAHTLQVTKHEN